MLYYLIATIYILSCLVLLMVVLLQQGKGGDIASAFGGSSSQTAFGARSGATLLSRATAVCAALFMIGALALAVLGHRGTGSVVGSAARPGAGKRAGVEARDQALGAGTNARAAGTCAAAICAAEVESERRTPVR